MIVIKLYLVRHGLKQKAIGDVSLTEQGIQQAQAVASYFSNIPVTTIISSPLRRAIETAQFTQLEKGLLLTEDSRLRERANWGDLPDQSFEEFIAMWDRCTREPSYIPPVGDSALQACSRMTSLINELINVHPLESNIVLVTHGGLITDYLANTFTEQQLNRFHPSFIVNQSMLVPECSITTLIYDGSSLRIEGFADVNHLHN